MPCENKIVHVIREGDSLYMLAKQYDTTVTELILGNPGANPYNLQIGTRLTICPGRRAVNGNGETEEAVIPQNGQPETIPYYGNGRIGRGRINIEGNPEQTSQSQPEMRNSSTGVGSTMPLNFPQQNERESNSPPEPQNERNRNPFTVPQQNGTDPNPLPEPQNERTRNPFTVPQQNGTDSNPLPKPQNERTQTPNAGAIHVGNTSPNSRWGMDRAPASNPASGNDSDSEDRMERELRREHELYVLTERMRRVWLDHVFWARMYLVSVINDDANQQILQNQMMQNVDDIVGIFFPFYPTNIIRQLRSLLVEHTTLTGEVIRLLQDGNMENYDQLMKAWYDNATELARFLGEQTPAYNEQELRNMFFMHLDLMKQQIEYRLAEEYERDIETFIQLENQVISMADYLAKGLLIQ